MKKLFYFMMLMLGMSIIISCNDINEDDEELTVANVKRNIACKFNNKHNDAPDFFWDTQSCAYYLENQFKREEYLEKQVYFTKDGYFNSYPTKPGKDKKVHTYKIVEENGEIHIYIDDFPYEYIKVIKCTKDELHYTWKYKQEIIDEVNKRRGGEEFEWTYIDEIKEWVMIYAVDLVDFVGGKAGEQSYWVYYYVKANGKLVVLWNWKLYLGWFDDFTYKMKKDVRGFLY